MPIYSVTKLEEALIVKTGKTLDGAKVAVLGLSYKANVGDDRESPAYIVIDALEKRGAHVTTYDPHMLEQSSANSLEEALTEKEAVVLVTGHDEFLKLQPKQLRGTAVFLDGRNTFIQQNTEFVDEGTTYLGIGLN